MTKEPIPTCLSTILKETGRQKVIIEKKINHIGHSDMKTTIEIYN